MIREDWKNAYYNGLYYWPGDKLANDMWFAYLAWDGL